MGLPFRATRLPRTNLLGGREPAEVGQEPGNLARRLAAHRVGTASAHSLRILWAVLTQCGGIIRVLAHVLRVITDSIGLSACNAPAAAVGHRVQAAGLADHARAFEVKELHCRAREVLDIGDRLQVQFTRSVVAWPSNWQYGSFNSM